MPNWVRNILVIKGAENDLHQFLSRMTCKTYPATGNKCFAIIDSLYPCPKELRDTKVIYAGPSLSSPDLQALYELNNEKFGYPHWDAWQKAEWGCTWGDIETKLESPGIEYSWSDDDAIVLEEDFLDEGYLRFVFDSAWSPPDAAFVAISKIFPHLRFTLRFVESCNHFKGESLFVNGTETYTELEYDTAWDDGYC